MVEQAGLPDHQKCLRLNHIPERNHRFMSETMLAVRFYAPGEALRLEEVPVPEPGPGQVLIEVKACGLCGSDLHIIKGETFTGFTPSFWATRPPAWWPGWVRGWRTGRRATGWRLTACSPAGCASTASGAATPSVWSASSPAYTWTALWPPSWWPRPAAWCVCPTG